VQMNIRPEQIAPIFSSVRLNLAYMFLNQDKKSTGLISNYVLDYLKHKFTAGLYHPIGKDLSVDWQFRWQDRQGTYTKYEDMKPAYESSYNPFGILDVKLNWRRAQWNYYVTLNNLFNATYYDLGNIPQPGFWIMGGVKCYLHSMNAF
jgi:hypothetical protein